MDYETSGGHEILLSFEDEFTTLFGLLRLRIPQNTIDAPGQAGVRALIRELHVYGPEVQLGGSEAGAVQHKGMGKSLLAEAERIAANEFGAKQVAILSGVGAREYYRNEGYRLESGYMVKTLNS
jgi:elongator complex protein 3